MSETPKTAADAPAMAQAMVDEYVESGWETDPAVTRLIEIAALPPAAPLKEVERWLHAEVYVHVTDWNEARGLVQAFRARFSVGPRGPYDGPTLETVIREVRARFGPTEETTSGESNE